MEVKEIEVIKKEKLYTFTEAELTVLKQRERNYGKKKTLEYIGFCLTNFSWKLNIAGSVNFIHELTDFICDGTYISNVYGLSYNEWLEDHP